MLVEGVVLISAVGIGVRATLGPVHVAAVLGGSGSTVALILSTLLGGTVSGPSPALSAFGLGASSGTEILLLVGGGGILIPVVGGSPFVLVLSPDVVISGDCAVVRLVVVRLGSNGIVRLAPSGVGVRAVGSLLPGIVVVATLGSTVPLGGTLLLTVVGVATVVAGTLSTVSGRATVAISAPAALAAGGVTVSTSAVLVTSLVGRARLARGGSLAVRGGTVDILIGSPSLSSPLVIILVLPFVIGLSIVRLGTNLGVSNLVGEVLISGPGIEVRVGSVLDAATGLVGGSLSLGTVVLGASSAGLSVSETDGSTVATEATVSTEGTATVATEGAATIATTVAAIAATVATIARSVAISIAAIRLATISTEGTATVARAIRLATISTVGLAVATPGVSGSNESAKSESLHDVDSWFVFDYYFWRLSAF